MRSAIPLLSIACACSSHPTGVEVRVVHDPSLMLDQIAFLGVLEDGSAAFPPGLAPDPPRALGRGEDSILLLLPARLEGRTIDISVIGMWSGNAVAEGKGSVLVVPGSIARLEIELTEVGARPSPDAGEEVDAGTRDAGGRSRDAGLASDAGPAGDAGTDRCTQRPVIVADGIDQDCDGFDECHQDLDGDGFGSSIVVSDDDLACSNASTRTAASATDCDDTDELVFPGTACDDGSGGSRNDICLGPLCRGYETSDCDSSCDSCGAGDCCSRDCRGSSCPSCPSDCSCDLSCGDHHTCRMTCEPGSVCHLTVRDAEEARMICADGASCDLECEDSGCLLECQGSARCIISSCDDSSCALDCAGAPMSCSDGMQTCNRACP